MGIQWIETRVGDKHLTHWKKENPQNIVASLSQISERNPNFLRKVGTEVGPTIYVFKHGPHELAVRQYDHGQRPHQIFDEIKSAADEKVALVETPRPLKYSDFFKTSV